MEGYTYNSDEFTPDKLYGETDGTDDDSPNIFQDEFGDEFGDYDEEEYDEEADSSTYEDDTEEESKSEWQGNPTPKEVVHTSEEIDTLIEEVVSQKSRVQQAEKDFGGDAGTAWLNDEYLASLTEDDKRHARWGVLSSFIAYSDKADTVYTFQNMLAYSDIAKEMLCQRVLNDTSLYDCILNNLGTVDNVAYEDMPDVTCPQCKSVISQREFKGNTVYTCDKCHINIDLNGNITETNVNSVCPICKEVFAEKNNSKICPKCKKQISSVQEFRAAVYTAYEDMGAVIDMAVYNLHVYLLRVYKYYIESINPPAGIIGYYPKGGNSANSANSVVCEYISKNKDGVTPSFKTAAVKGLSKYTKLNPYWTAIANSLDITPDKLGSVGAYDYRKKVAELKPDSLKGFVSFSGFHLYHLFGYFKVGETVVRVDNCNVLDDSNFAYDENDLFNYDMSNTTNQFSRYLASNLLNSIWNYLYKYSNTESTRNTLGWLLKQPAIDVSSEMYRVCETKVRSIVDLVVRAYKNMLILNTFTDTQVHIDVLSSEPAWRKSAVLGLHALCSLKDGKFNYVFADSGIAPQVVYAKPSKAIQVGSEGVLDSFIVVTNPDAFFAFPLFAYEPMLKLKEKVGLSAKDVLVGETMDKRYVYLHNLIKQNGVLLFATSRAGKGVMTLALLAALFASKQPIAYIDSKPDMCGIVKSIALKQGTNMLAMEMGVKYEPNNEWWAKMPENTLPYFTREQKNWGENYKSGGVVIEAWKKYFGIAPPPMSATRFLYYSKVVQLAFVFQAYMFAKYKEKCIFILDEITGVTSASAMRKVSTWVKSAQDEVQKIHDAVHKKPKKGEEAPTDVMNYAGNFNTWIQYFLASVTDAGNFKWQECKFSAWLDDKLSKLGAAFPLFIVIGQSYTSLMRGPSSGNARLYPWSTMLGRRIATEGIIIQGNWHADDTAKGESDKSKKSIEVEYDANDTVEMESSAPAADLAIIQALKNAGALEYKNKYIHAGINGVSGFFAIRQGNSVEVARTYLVLNKNTAEYTEAENQVRDRVIKALGTKGEDPGVQNRLNTLLYQNYDDSKLMDLSKAKYTPEAEQAVGVVRRPEVGFEGYMQMIAGDSPLDTGYAKFQEAFKAIPFVQLKGYETVEDYIYDLSPDSFLTTEELMASSIDEFIELRKQNGGILPEETGNSSSADSEFGDTDEDFETTQQVYDNISGESQGDLGGTADSEYEPDSMLVSDTDFGDQTTVESMRSQLQTLHNQVQHFYKNLSGLLLHKQRDTIVQQMPDDNFEAFKKATQTARVALNTEVKPSYNKLSDAFDAIESSLDPETAEELNSLFDSIADTYEQVANGVAWLGTAIQTRNKE